MYDFDIQRFGTNDTITSSDELQIKFGFVDDDRTQNIPNFNTDTDSDTISNLSTWIVTNQPILGDKEWASATGIISATHIEKTVTKLDLT